MWLEHNMPSIRSFLTASGVLVAFGTLHAIQPQGQAWWKADYCAIKHKGSADDDDKKPPSQPLPIVG